jgi:uncharacterized protein (TIGR00255 family)
MIRSMTGFGAGRGSAGGEDVDVEIRSVNHKYAEVKARLPRELAALEQEIVRAVKERLARGGIDVSVRRSTPGGAVVPRVDVSVAEAYARAFKEIQARLGLPGALSLSDVLSAEGVVRLEERAVDLEAAGDALRRALARDLSTRLGSVEAAVARVAELSPQVVEHYRARLEERIAELTRGVPLDPARLVQEVALFADRTDVAEEITRLRSHVAQVRQLLASAEPAGRKLDFLVQEMHREVNTIGSKSQSAELASIVVGLKAEIERMREQVQNVE